MSTPRSSLAPTIFRLSRKMEESVTPLSVLGPQCEAQRERILRLFNSGATAQDTLRQLCELADESIQKVFSELLRTRDTTGQGLCLLALGGYGREMLFPYSDLDLLFLFGSDKVERSFGPSFRNPLACSGSRIPRQFRRPDFGRMSPHRSR